MYDELVNSLRICGKIRSADDYCVAFHDGCCEAEPVCMYELMMKAADAIEELQSRVKVLEKVADKWCEAVPKWIPVTEQLPVGGDDSGAICENVCLLMDDGTVSCGWMNGITKKVYYLNARDDVVIKAPITRVTHWMPLPQPPEEET